MLKRALLKVISVTGSLVMAGLLTGMASSERPPRPVVVELFTAQGCSGCPEANRLLEGVDREPGVIALTYGVTYWDYLGWSDTFARPEFTARQQAYRQALQLRDVATPQIVIDGQRQLVGGQAPELQAAIDAVNASRTDPPEIEFRQTGDRVGVGSGRSPSGGAEVVAVIYKPGVQIVEVQKGDNRGQTVRHINVVREVHRLGAWTGRPVLYALPQKKAPEDKVVVLVQGQSDRRILTAARQGELQRD